MLGQGKDLRADAQEKGLNNPEVKFEGGKGQMEQPVLEQKEKGP